MLKPERHIWTEDSTYRAVVGTEYDKAWEYIAALEAELATVLDVAIARGEQLHYEDLDYRERLASLVPQEAGNESQNAM